MVSLLQNRFTLQNALYLTSITSLFTLPMTITITIKYSSLLLLLLPFFRRRAPALWAVYLDAHSFAFWLVGELQVCLFTRIFCPCFFARAFALLRWQSAYIEVERQMWWMGWFTSSFSRYLVAFSLQKLQHKGINIFMVHRYLKIRSPWYWAPRKLVRINTTECVVHLCRRLECANEKF